MEPGGGGGGEEERSECRQQQQQRQQRHWQRRQGCLGEMGNADGGGGRQRWQGGCGKRNRSFVVVRTRGKKALASKAGRGGNGSTSIGRYTNQTSLHPAAVFFLFFLFYPGVQGVQQTTHQSQQPQQPQQPQQRRKHPNETFCVDTESQSQVIFGQVFIQGPVWCTH